MTRNPTQLALTALFAWAALVEAAHARRGIEKAEILETAGPLVAAVCLLYMASEAYEGQYGI
jgi:hypothetical protein